MDQNTTSSAPRKVRFAPKPPPRRKLVLAEPDIDDDQDGDKAAAEDVKSQEAFIRRVNDNIARQRPKAEKKTPVQVAFTQAPGSASTMRTFGKAKDRKNVSSSKSSAVSDEGILISSSTGKEGDQGYPLTDVGASYEKKRKDYKEPWDYDHSYYPTSLPLRRPYSGNPELLDEAEFGLSGMRLEYDEKTINPASELGLLEKSDQTQIIFLQLPAKLPLDKLSNNAKGGTLNSVTFERKGASRSLKGKAVVGGSSGGSPSSAAAKGKETGDSSIYEAKRNASKPCSLRDLPQGYIGKMLVYKSGAIKWKIGDIIYDVFPGESCIFPQDVVAINTADKHCCVLGEISKRAVVTPDVDSLLGN